MKNWSVQDARTRFNDMLDACVREGPQTVTSQGREVAVLVPVAEWLRLNAAAKPTLKDLLLSNEARAELPAPARGSAKRRPPPAFE